MNLLLVKEFIEFIEFIELDYLKENEDIYNDDKLYDFDFGCDYNGGFIIGTKKESKEWIYDNANVIGKRWFDVYLNEDDKYGEITF